MVKKFLILLLIGLVSTLSAQDVEPLRWTPLPLGTQVVGLGYGYTSGTVLFDPLLEAEDVRVELNTIVFAYVHSFRIGKQFARVDALVPFSFGRWEGLLSGAPAEVNRTGFSDPRLRISINLLGPNASGPKELRNYYTDKNAYTLLGVSLAVNVPMGQYNDEKLINLGQNQFIFRPQIGIVRTWGLWSFEYTTSVYIYTRNNNFFNNQDKVQDPKIAAQTHLIKRFKSKWWGSASLAYGLGGSSIVNNRANNDRNSNLLSALTLGFPISSNQTGKLTYFRTETLRDVGSDTNSLVLIWTINF